jgi:toxin ParE1/3/4
MRRVRFSVKARCDLEEIEEYISRDNPDAAARFVSTILDKCVLLSEQSGIGRSRAELQTNLRSFPCGNYIIFYHPLDDGVEIIRFLHGARDVRDLFELA